MTTTRIPRRRATAVRKATPGLRLLAIADAKDATGVVEQVRAGFPFSKFVRLEKASGLSRDALARLLGIPKRTLTRRQSDGRLRPDESDRVLRAAAIFELAHGLFEGDTAAATEWLESPQPALGGESPLAFAATEVGAREVEQLIGRLEHGVFP